MTIVHRVLIGEAQTFLRALLSVGLLAACLGIARAEKLDQLLIYGVTVNRTPIQSWGPGNGIYLGRGLVLTAAHVVGRTFWTRPKVTALGQELSTQTVKEGSLEGIDLTLLRVDERSLPVSLGLRMNPICRMDPFPGQEVAAVIRDRIVYSRVLSPTVLPPRTRKYRTVIGDVAKTASSGAGVFDIRRKCLLGIVSRKISARVGSSNQMQDIATYFVPASEIREFISARHQ